MKIVYIELTNFAGVKAAMGLKKVSIEFDKIEKPIIQIYGKNRCGKTVLLQQLHPFSSINLNGDERSDLNIIIPNETGVKHIVYELNGVVYDITHTYKPTSKGNHTVTSSIKQDGVELNPGGGVGLFNDIINRVFGINRYIFQFVINGTQLTSFSNMSSTERKHLLNKAMGIDIYDKINKLATEDYRYTNKLISSLNGTKEYLLSQYGSFETLCKLLHDKQLHLEQQKSRCDELNNRINVLRGILSTLSEHELTSDMAKLQQSASAYKNVVDIVGEFDNTTYDKLVTEQLSLNDTLHDLKTIKLLKTKDLDDKYSKRENIQQTLRDISATKSEYDSMCRIKDSLMNKLNSIEDMETTDTSASSIFPLMNIAQTVNGICKEICLSLDEEYLKMLVDMMIQNIDVNDFLMRESSVLLDGEKEKGVIDRLHGILDNVSGEYPSGCESKNCIYFKSHKLLNTYFDSYKSATSSKFTTYTLEQMNIAYKNIMTIQRLINISVPTELEFDFKMESIFGNMISRPLDGIGIDVNNIRHLIDVANKTETRNGYISQLNDVNKNISMLEKQMNTDGSDSEAVLANINEQIVVLQNEISDISHDIDDKAKVLAFNDKKRMMLSNVQQINIDDINKRYIETEKKLERLMSTRNELNSIQQEYVVVKSAVQNIERELKVLQDAHSQYTSTVAEITKHADANNKYKIIAEATSSTKGKPVLAISDTVNSAILTANKLLDVMYAENDKDMELLPPIINENEFSLPFRCGINTSRDVRYGSQSEQMILSLVLSMSLASSLSIYNVFPLDECDSYLDMEMSDNFVYMIYTMMGILQIEQVFVISHHIEKDTSNKIVHQLDLSEIITKLE